MGERRRYFFLVMLGFVLGATTDASAVTMEGFGRCLKSKGATFYGASWCPHCRAQEETLGEAKDYVKYVECSIDGTRETAPACRAANVDGYPTWKFADGSRETGKQSLAELGAKTGCALPKSAE